MLNWGFDSVKKVGPQFAFRFWTTYSKKKFAKEILGGFDSVIKDLC